MKKYSVILLILLMIGMNALQAQETDTGTLSVSATVETGCALGSGTLNFGTYIAGQETDLDAQGSISYTNCSGQLIFELDGGQNGSVNSRALLLADQELSYQLFQNAARSQVWGIGTEARQLNLTDLESGSVTVFGRIPANQQVQSGIYTDTVNVTLNF